MTSDNIAMACRVKGFPLKMLLQNTDHHLFSGPQRRKELFQFIHQDSPSASTLYQLLDMRVEFCDTDGLRLSVIQQLHHQPEPGEVLHQREVYTRRTEPAPRQLGGAVRLQP